jgi:TfoX/Sxy family transcriptional regulator of competence genes
MAFDNVLAERVSDQLAETGAGALGKKMFGGIAFLIDGNMTVGVIGDDLIARVGADGTEAALARPGAHPFDMTGRPMNGWVVVDGSVLDDDVLADWIAEARAFVATLPPK